MAVKYIFSNKIHEIEGMFGVEHSSLNEEEISLFEINSENWSPELIGDLVIEAKALGGADKIQFTVDESHLLMIIDSVEVSFYSSWSDSQDPDFVWPFDKFITFMEAFKKFIEENS